MSRGRPVNGIIGVTAPRHFFFISSQWQKQGNTCMSFLYSPHVTGASSTFPLPQQYLGELTYYPIGLRMFMSDIAKLDWGSTQGPKPMCVNPPCRIINTMPDAGWSSPLRVTTLPLTILLLGTAMAYIWATVGWACPERVLRCYQVFGFVLAKCSQYSLKSLRPRPDNTCKKSDSRLKTKTAPLFCEEILTPICCMCRPRLKITG